MQAIAKIGSRMVGIVLAVTRNYLISISAGLGGIKRGMVCLSMDDAIAID